MEYRGLMPSPPATSRRSGAAAGGLYQKSPPTRTESRSPIWHCEGGRGGGKDGGGREGQFD